MRKVEELQQQILTLSREQFAELRVWFWEHDAIVWDAQIEDDAKSGKLDELISKGQAEYKSGRTRKL